MTEPPAQSTDERVQRIEDALDWYSGAAKTYYDKCALARKALTSLAADLEQAERERDVAQREAKHVARAMRDVMADLKQAEQRAARLLREISSLRTEVDCRIEHGAESGGHLEYVRDRLDAALADEETV